MDYHGRISYSDEQWGWTQKLEPLLQDLHGRQAAYLCCKRCGGFASYHEYPKTGLFIDACWACKRNDDVGTCWCEFCRDRVGALCNTCGNKGPAQCDCPVSVEDTPKKKKIKKDEDSQKDGPFSSLPRPPSPKYGKYFKAEELGVDDEHKITGDKLTKMLGPDWKFIGVQEVKIPMERPKKRKEKPVEEPTDDSKDKKVKIEHSDACTLADCDFYESYCDLFGITLMGNPCILKEDVLKRFKERLSKCVQEKKKALFVIHGPNNFFCSDNFTLTIVKNDPSELDLPYTEGMSIIKLP